MAVEPPTPLNFMKNYAPDLRSVIQRVSCFAKFLPPAKFSVKETSEPIIVSKLELYKNYKGFGRLLEFMGCEIREGEINSLYESKSDAVIPFVGADKVMWNEAANELKRRLPAKKNRQCIIKSVKF